MGLPGAVIEDLAFTDVRITAPGALKAAEVCPLEWLDYTQLYPEENRHLEPMPPTHFYCKHTGALSFSHCFFGCEQPDERPAVVAEDVRFLALYQTRAENSGGLLRHIACPVIRGDFAAQEAQPYTDAQTALWTTYREEAAALNDAMERVAALFDGLQAPRCLCEQAAAPGTKTAAMTIERQEPGHTYLFCPAARGAWELRINGSTIDRFPMPPYFRFSTPLLWDITPHLTGSNDCVELAAASAEAELTAARIQLLHTLR